MPFRVIPVIDLLGGHVVRGVAGERAKYRPIESRLSPRATPASIAKAFATQFDFREAYVADLDAISGAGQCLTSYQDIDAAGLNLMLDAGIGSVGALQMLIDSLAGLAARTTLVIGLESLRSFDDLQKMAESTEPERLCFSLDLKRGVPLAHGADFAGVSAEAIAERVVALGIRQMIVLDLAGVGVSAGVPTLDLCRRITSTHHGISLISGGGVRGLADLRSLSEAGCEAALVASALHDGTLTPPMLRQW